MEAIKGPFWVVDENGVPLRATRFNNVGDAFRWGYDKTWGTDTDFRVLDKFYKPVPYSRRFDDVASY